MSSGLKITPTIGLSYYNTGIRAYGETNGNILNLNVREQNASSAIVSLGSQFSYDIRWNQSTLTPFLNISYEHELTDSSRAITTELATQPGIPIRNRIGKSNLDIVRLGIGVRGRIQDSISVMVGYETVLGNQFTTSHAIHGQLKYTF